MLSLKIEDKFTIIRFSAWTATHDVRQTGILDKMAFIEELSKYGKVFVSAEGQLPNDIEKFKLTIHPVYIHDLLYYASLYVGEGASMATEAALLGTPSVYVSSLSNTMGNLLELEKKYDLLHSFSNPSEALKYATMLISENGVKQDWRVKRNHLLNDKIDVTSFLVWFISYYPESLVQIKEDPALQNKFKTISS